MASNQDKHSTIKEFLQRKDSNYDKYIPASYKTVAAQKPERLLLDHLFADYSMRSATGCIKHCFKNMESPVVSMNEGECMTNCTTKALETLSHFQLNNLNRQ